MVCRSVNRSEQNPMARSSKRRVLLPERSLARERSGGRAGQGNDCRLVHQENRVKKVGKRMQKRSKDAKLSAWTGQERTGQERTGQERTGQDSSGGGNDREGDSRIVLEERSGSSRERRKQRVKRPGRV